MADQITATLNLALDREGPPLSNGRIDVDVEYGEDAAGRKVYRHVIRTEWRPVP